jgi:hypothetical protein
MRRLFQFALMLSCCAVTAWGQTTPPAQPPAKSTPAQSQMPQADVKPADNEPPKEPPPSPGATLKEGIEAGMKAQPACMGDYHPCVLTSHQKLRMFERKSYSPFTFLNAAFSAGYSQISGDTYGPGMRGVGKRYGANLADAEASSFFQTYLFSSVFHQDPRYHRIGTGGLLYRASYAASRVLIGRKDDGRSTLNWPEFLGVAATVTLANAYYPDHDCGVGRTLSRGFGSIASDAGTEVMREFWPDVRRILHRHEPKSMQRIEQKITALASPSPKAGSGASPEN